jgi:hypothetical protein
MDLVFLFIYFNQKIGSIGNRALYFFFIYIKLFQSYEQNHGFNMLSRVDLVCFFNLFFILSLNIGLVEN